jgi:hypothetical protein
MKKMMLLVFVFVFCIGCQAAHITASKWDTGVPGEKAQVRCEWVDMRSNDHMKQVFSRYDGWKMIYISEYTTGNRFGTEGVVCFERAKP